MCLPAGVTVLPGNFSFTCADERAVRGGAAILHVLIAVSEQKTFVYFLLQVPLGPFSSNLVFADIL